MRGYKHKKNHLTEQEVEKIKTLYKEGTKAQTLAGMFHVKDHNIMACINGTYVVDMSKWSKEQILLAEIEGRL